MEKDARCASNEIDCEREGRWPGRSSFQCGHSNAASLPSPHKAESSGAALSFLVTRMAACFCEESACV